MSIDKASKLAGIVRQSGVIGPSCNHFVADYPRCSLKLSYFPEKGRGVIAGEDIPRRTLIERSPVIIIPANARPYIDETVIFAYAFHWEVGAIDQDMYSGEGRLAIPLGFATLLNHSTQPNAQCRPQIENFAMDVVALRDISEGEEITIEYKMDLWF